MPRRRRRRRQTGSRGPRSGLRGRKVPAESDDELPYGRPLDNRRESYRQSRQLRPYYTGDREGSGGSLSKGDIRLYLDGSEKSRFHYDQASGQLSYYVGRALPRHPRGKIEAEATPSRRSGPIQRYGQQEMDLHGGASLRTRGTAL